MFIIHRRFLLFLGLIITAISTNCIAKNINQRELITLTPLIILTLVMGIYPEIFLGPMHAPVNSLIEYVHACAGK